MGNFHSKITFFVFIFKIKVIFERKKLFATIQIGCWKQHLRSCYTLQTQTTCFSSDELNLRVANYHLHRVQLKGASLCVTGATSCRYCRLQTLYSVLLISFRARTHHRAHLETWLQTAYPSASASPEPSSPTFSWGCPVGEETLRMKLIPTLRFGLEMRSCPVMVGDGSLSGLLKGSSKSCHCQPAARGIPEEC